MFPRCPRTQEIPGDSSTLKKPPVFSKAPSTSVNKLLISTIYPPTRSHLLKGLVSNGSIGFSRMTVIEYFICPLTRSHLLSCNPAVLCHSACKSAQSRRRTTMTLKSPTTLSSRKLTSLSLFICRTLARSLSLLTCTHTHANADTHTYKTNTHKHTHAAL